MIITTTQFTEGQTIERKLADARQIAEAELADEARARVTDAVDGVDLDYEFVCERMLMVSMSGTAVVVA
ncbi:MAG: hypothetical protein EBW03_04505 [Rhodobacteraceae bacterium]|nr:hypothetical protein [Paracoccaceae bacterium]